MLCMFLPLPSYVPLRRLHLIEAACSFAPLGGFSKLYWYDESGLALLLSAFVIRVYVGLIIGESGKIGVFVRNLGSDIGH